ncbi:MAG: phage Gp37/Gp68 family protein, partial [Clostridia bacterium]|nr:phage Gp37/Gp68 family protein [Clostridia bacterium]
MRDIWNPWHGCKKCSEGCQNCYMYYLDRVHGNFASNQVVKTGNMNYPLSKSRSGKFVIRSGEMLRVCMTSDFFIEEADKWREEAWDV